jgi:glycine cleavage system H protein
MSNIPEDLRYAKTHEWVRVDEEADIVTVGITDYAQQSLGDLVFVELPEVGQELEAGEECAVVESVKAASDIYSPLSGEVVEVNTVLIDSPELVNSSPYGDGWLIKLKPEAIEDELRHLLAPDEYANVIEENEE